MEKINVKQLKKVAKSNSEASLLLARMSFEGKGGVPQSDKEGIKWAKKASKKGNLYANNFMGFVYANGYGVSRNVKKAAQFYTKAKAFEDGLAEYSLYVLTNSGELGKKAQRKSESYLQAAEEKKNCYVTYNDAVKLNKEYQELINNLDITKEELDIANYKKQASIVALKQAHAEGCEDATLALAIIYLTGDGVDQDFEEAKRLLGMLDEQKCPLINYIYGYMYDTGLCFDQDYWKAYDCYQKVYKYYKDRELKKDGENATIALALCSLTGLGCPMNELKAFQSFCDLAKNTQNAVAEYYVGVCYAEGRGTKQDYKTAGIHFKKAAEAGVARAYYQLGKLCDINYHKDNNKPDKCFKFYEQAAQAGVAEGKIGLARCYRDGNGVDKDAHKAYDLVSQAARQGNAEALYEYANLYVKGEFVAQDIEEAVKYMTEAAKRGSKEAVKFLDDVYTKGGVIEKDAKKAFEVKELRALNGDEELYIKLAEHYRKGIKGVVEKNGEMAAYWYAKTVLESKSKRERQKAANRLKLFDRTLEGDWNFKKIVKKINAKLIKKQKYDAKLAKKNGGVAPVEEKIEENNPLTDFKIADKYKEPVASGPATPVEELTNNETVQNNENTFKIEPIKFDDMMSETKDEKKEDDKVVEEIKADETVKEKDIVSEEVKEELDTNEVVKEEDTKQEETKKLPSENDNDLDLEKITKEANSDVKQKSKKELKEDAKAAEKQAKIDAENAKKQAKIDAENAKKQAKIDAENAKKEAKKNKNK